MPTLTQALTQMCIQEPEDPIYWLAQVSAGQALSCAAVLGWIGGGGMTGLACFCHTDVKSVVRPLLCSGWSRIIRRNRRRPNGTRFEADATSCCEADTTYSCCEHQCPLRLRFPASSERVLLVSLQALVLKLSSGDYFGEIALLSGKPRQASVKAVGQVTVLVMSRDAFTRLCGNLFGNCAPPTEEHSFFAMANASRDELIFAWSVVLTLCHYDRNPQAQHVEVFRHGASYRRGRASGRGPCGGVQPLRKQVAVFRCALTAPF